MGAIPFQAMLSELFGGQQRWRVLRALFEKPDQELHLRGVAAAAGIDAGNTHRILKRLIAAELCERIAAVPYAKFRARRDNPLYPDLVRLFSRGSELVNDLRVVAGSIDGMAAIYGSVARGEDRAESDIDVLVIGPMSTIMAQAAFKPAGRKHGRRINVTAASQTELLEKIKAGSAFWRDVLTGPLIKLKGEMPDEIARGLSQGGEQGIPKECARSARHRKLRSGSRR